MQTISDIKPVNLSVASAIIKRICLVCGRCPDTASVHMKMLYAASKDAVKKKLTGMTHEIQATEHSELNKDEVTAKLMAKAYK